MLRRNRVRVAGGVEVALGVVEGVVGDAFFGVCAVPRFTEVLCASVGAAQRGFDGARVRVCCLVVCAVLLVPVVVYEVGAVAFNCDGDSRLVVVSDVAGEVVSLFVGEGVPRVGECGYDREVGGGGEECGGVGGLVDVGVASFLLGCFLRMRLL